MNVKAWTHLSWAWVLACLSGCLIEPGRIDENLVARYQKSVLERSPQRRAGEEGLDLLRPLPEGARPALKVVEDPVTGQKGVLLSLDEAIRMALANNPDIRVLSFDPAIAREDMVRAAAAFDAVVFGGVLHTWADHRLDSSAGSGQTDTGSIEVGVRNKNVLGGDAELKWNFTRTRDDGLFTTLDDRHESMMSLELTQPLLRGAGPEYNLAPLRLAEVSCRSSYADFRRKVEEVVAQIQTAYWQLVQVRGELKIVQGVLREGESTLEKVKARVGLDARENIEVQQAVVAVEQRRAAVIRAKKVVSDVENAVARLVADPRLNLTTEYRIVPAEDQPVLAKYTVEPIDQLITALRYSPVLEAARLAIEAARINVRVAQNETLPSLTLTAGAGLDGLKRNAHGAIEDMLTFDYVDYTVGLLMEYPLGNRQAEARLRQQRFEQRRAQATLQTLADQVAVAINETIRQIQANYDEIGAQEKVVEALEKNIIGLQASMDLSRQSYLLMLELMLREQDALGAAKRLRLQAMVNFKNAQVRLAQLTGTSLHQQGIRLIAEEVAAYPPSGPGAPPATLPATAPKTP